MSDFPRGWTLTNDSNGGVATITVAAITGVVHVLDGLLARLTNDAAAAATSDLLQLSSSDGVFASFVLGRITVSATVGSVDEISLSGLDLAAGPGASLTIAFSGGGAGFAETLIIQGHDI